MTWVRCTQFAGDHMFCEECARSENDFGRLDSYRDWCSISEYLLYLEKR